MGVHCPIIRTGDDLVEIVSNTVINEGLQDGDVIGITESIVARANGLYVTVDDIANDIRKKYGDNATIVVVSPIYSRNRFAMILKGIARAASKILFEMPEYDEVGNPIGVNPFTGVNIKEYYRDICASEGCSCEFAFGEIYGIIDKKAINYHYFHERK